MSDQLQPEAVCGTWRLEFVLKREDIHKCVKNEALTSLEYKININCLDTKWCIKVYPWGSDDYLSEDDFTVEMKLLSCGSYEGVIWGAMDYAVKTAYGYQPGKFENSVGNVDDMYYNDEVIEWKKDAQNGRSEGEINIRDDIYDNGKLTLVVFLRLCMKELEKFTEENKKRLEKFTGDLRSVVELDHLHDVMVTCGGETIPCHANILSVR